MARIALVEDDSDISHLMREVLNEAGHEVVPYFQPSTDILQHVKNYCPDLVILDLRLTPTVSGWDIIDAVKSDSDTQDIPLILVTGAREQIEQHSDLLDRLNVPVLLKPFDIGDLSSLVDRALATN